MKQKMLMFKSSMKHACKRACQSLASRASVESDSESVNLDRYVLSRTLSLSTWIDMRLGLGFFVVFVSFFRIISQSHFMFEYDLNYLISL